MKWTRTDEIEFDLEDLPDEICDALAKQILSQVSVGILVSGRFFTYHEQDEDQLRVKEITLSDEMRDLVKNGKESELRKMLATLDEARAIVEGGLPHNAEGKPTPD